jgi:hypothetical protein
MGRRTAESRAAEVVIQYFGFSTLESANGTYETYWLGDIGSAFEVKPDIGPPFTEVRV